MVSFSGIPSAPFPKPVVPYPIAPARQQTHLKPPTRYLTNGPFQLFGLFSGSLRQPAGGIRLLQKRTRLPFCARGQRGHRASASKRGLGGRGAGGSTLGAAPGHPAAAGGASRAPALGAPFLGESFGCGGAAEFVFFSFQWRLPRSPTKVGFLLFCSRQAVVCCVPVAFSLSTSIFHLLLCVKTHFLLVFKDLSLLTCGPWKPRRKQRTATSLRSIFDKEVGGVQAMSHYPPVHVPIEPIKVSKGSGPATMSLRIRKRRATLLELWPGQGDSSVMCWVAFIWSNTGDVSALSRDIFPARISQN